MSVAIEAVPVVGLDSRELHEVARRMADLRASVLSGPLAVWSSRALSAIAQEASSRGLYRTELLCHLSVSSETYGVAECLCGWVTPVCETNDDAAELLLSHLDAVVAP